MVGWLLVIEIIFVIDWRDLYFSFVNLWKGDWMDLMGNEIEEKKKKRAITTHLPDSNEDKGRGTFDRACT